MYDVRQFKPAMYVLILFGIAGFAWASASPGSWALSTGAILIHIWLEQTDRFRPLPRLVANVVTVMGIVLVGSVMQQAGGPLLLVIGQFLVLLQVIKLYEHRTNRDYAQLLVLSLLLMVAAAISTASLVFGVALIVYMFLSLYCCLLFHLKTEADHARQVIGVWDEDERSVMLRQDQRHFSRSMRRLTVLVAIAAMIGAVLTFVLFPRGANAGFYGQQMRFGQALTGFSETVSFQNVARITQNTREIAWVKVTRDGKPYRGILLLRGLTLNRYTGPGSREEDPYQWKRSLPDPRLGELPANKPWQLFDPRDPILRDVPLWRHMVEQVPELPRTAMGNELRQQIKLNPTGASALFAIGGMMRFKPEATGQFMYTPQDEVLQFVDPPMQPIRYEVISRDVLTGATGFYMSPTLSRIDPRIADFARRPEVSGSDEQGPLAERRRNSAAVTPLDIEIARSIEAYLSDNFIYTLDLTDAVRIQDKDPIEAFLYDLKRGHCEYFAGAMTLMCQSLGLKARLVIGFKCDEYNSVGEYFIVRQSHAHAWVEVLRMDGVWQTFDPTTANEDPTSRMETWWEKTRALFSYMEFQWENSVIAYDQTRRSSILQTLDNSARSAALEGSQRLNQLWNWRDRPFISWNILDAVISLMMAVLVGSVAWFLWEKSKLRRRARRIGLGALPVPEQMKLARQLRFYDELMRLLDRHGISRVPHLTPMEFGNSLTFLPADTFGAIQRLTRTFYRVRYGRAELSADEQQELVHVIVGLEASMGSPF